MPYITLSNAKLAKRIKGIKYSNEMLNEGVSELEALYLRMQSGRRNSERTKKASETAALINERNHSLADAINEALKEVESSLKEQRQMGLAIDPENIHSFTNVLRESIKIFYEYRLIQDEYQHRLQHSYRQSFYHFTSDDKRSHNKENRRSLSIIQQIQAFIMSLLCVCGGGMNDFD